MKWLCRDFIWSLGVVMLVLMPIFLIMRGEYLMAVGLAAFGYFVMVSYG